MQGSSSSSRDSKDSKDKKFEIALKVMRKYQLQEYAKRQGMDKGDVAEANKQYGTNALATLIRKNTPSSKYEQELEKIRGIQNPKAVDKSGQPDMQTAADKNLLTGIEIERLEEEKKGGSQGGSLRGSINSQKKHNQQLQDAVIASLADQAMNIDFQDQVMNTALKIDSEMKSNAFPQTRAIRKQSGISEKVVRKAFESDIITLKSQISAHSNQKRSQQAKVIFKKVVQEMAGKAKSQNSQNTRLMAQIEQLDQQIAAKSNQINALEREEEKPLNLSLQDLQNSETFSQAQEQYTRHLEFLEQSIQEQMEQKLELEQQREQLVIQLKPTESPMMGSTGVENQGPDAGRKQVAATPHTPSKPNSVQYQLERISMSLSQSGKSKQEQAQMLQQAKEAVRSSQVQKAESELPKAAPNGVGGDAQDAVAAENRDPRVPLAQQEIDLQDVLGAQSQDDNIYNIAEFFNLEGAQQNYLANSVQNGSQFAENYNALEDYPHTGTKEEKKIHEQIVSAYIANLRRQNPKKPVPNNPKQIVLVTVPKTSMEEDPIVKKTPAQRKADAKKKFEKDNPRPVVSAQDRKAAKAQAQQGYPTASITITLYDYVEYMFKAADFISKIEGDINPGDPLTVYKTKTSVFTPKIAKLESNEFKITPNSAFKVRACC